MMQNFADTLPYDLTNIFSNQKILWLGRREGEIGRPGYGTSRSSKHVAVALEMQNRQARSGYHEFLKSNDPTNVNSMIVNCLLNPSNCKDFHNESKKTETLRLGKGPNGPKKVLRPFGMRSVSM